MTSELDWQQDVPFSLRFQDVYYSKSGGLDEARHVYLRGVGLENLAQQSAGKIVRLGELGFGTGLNFLASWALWQASGTSSCLHYVAVEKCPLAKEDMARALRNFSEIRHFTENLLSLLPGVLPGMHRLWLDRHVVLDLWIGDVQEVLPQWHGCFDGWYMDGFSPKRNPEMFSAQVCQHLARRSASGAKVATFSVAGEVQRNLMAAGFAVEKREGFAHKRQCLCAEYTWQSSWQNSVKNLKNSRVAILGAGIAGASCAEQLTRLGISCSVFSGSRSHPASDVPIAAVAPRFSASHSARGRDGVFAYHYALHYYANYPEAIRYQGAIKFPSSGISLSRLQRACEHWSTFSTDAPQMLSAHELSALIASKAQHWEGAQYLDSALVLCPKTLRAALMKKVASHHDQQITELLREDAWWLVSEDGQKFGPFDAVILACGCEVTRFLPTARDCTKVRSGAVEYYHAEKFPPLAMGGWGGHYVPDQEGFWYGYSRAEKSGKTPLMLKQLHIAAKASGTVWQAEKLNASHHWPLSGAVPNQQNLYVLAGSGGHGFAIMPWLASKVAMMVCGYNCATEKRLE